jgi:hypothetical protein
MRHTRIYPVAEFHITYLITPFFSSVELHTLPFGCGAVTKAKIGVRRAIGPSHVFTD